MLIEVKFGLEAIPYFDSCLLRGKTLAAHILNHQRLETGQIIGYLPPNVPFEERVQFVAGGIFDTPIDRQKTVDLILSFLSGPGRRYAVFEDAYAKSNDPWTREPKTQFFSFEFEVYHFLTSRDQKREKITQTLRWADGYPFIGALTSLPADDLEIEHCQEVTRGILEKLAKRVEYVLIGAYDNETMLIWSPS
jgi:hypothetical protein